MSLNTNSNALAEKLQSRDATREPTWVRYTLIAIALIFFLSCLILPLILVLLKRLNKALAYILKPSFIQILYLRSN